jgi:hypothetical protein
VAAQLLLDQVARGLAGAEAGDAYARRELPISPFKRLSVALGLDLYLEEDLSLG